MSRALRRLHRLLQQTWPTMELLSRRKAVKSAAGSADGARSLKANMARIPGMVIGGVAGLAVATIAVPTAVGAAGFTGAGIAAGSLAAKMMSAAAVAKGGGVAAGSTVAVLQSVGAAGLSAATKAAVTAGGALLSAIFR